MLPECIEIAARWISRLRNVMHPLALDENWLASALSIAGTCRSLISSSCH